MTVKPGSHYVIPLSVFNLPSPSSPRPGREFRSAPWFGSSFQFLDAGKPGYDIPQTLRIGVKKRALNRKSALLSAGKQDFNFFTAYNIPSWPSLITPCPTRESRKLSQYCSRATLTPAVFPA
jgi:hypothetical protein